MIIQDEKKDLWYEDSNMSLVTLPDKRCNKTVHRYILAITDIEIKREVVTWQRKK